MNGIVTGGWSFVWAAYTVSATILVAYSIHVISDFRKSMAKRAALTGNTKGASA
jgi:heme exporter protein D